MDPFEVLGVSRTSTREEVTRAYRRLAQLYHPDRLSGLPDDVRAEAERRMKELNAAYDVVRSNLQQAAQPQYSAPDVDPRSSSTRHTRVDEQPPQGVDEEELSFCHLCGHTPSRNVTFRRGTGLLVWRIAHTIRSELCRECGEAIYRETQNQTLLKGWWGALAALTNIFYIVSNKLEVDRIRELSRPRKTRFSKATPLERPLSPGQPLSQRAGGWVTAGLLVLVALSVAAGARFGDPPHQAEMPALDDTEYLSMQPPESPVRQVAAPILSTIRNFFAAINRGDYHTAWRMQTVDRRARTSYAAFASGHSTSTISLLRASNPVLRSSARAEVIVNFRSHQDAQYGPDGEECTDWNLRYSMVLFRGAWLIDSAKADSGSGHTPCLVVATPSPTIDHPAYEYPFATPVVTPPGPVAADDATPPPPTPISPQPSTTEPTPTATTSPSPPARR